MTALTPARRRAEEFATLVDGTDRALSTDRYAELLSLVADLRTVESPEPRAEFVAGLRERLMVEADSVLHPRDLATEERLRLPGRTTVSPPNRRLAVAAGAIAMVGASASMAVAAQTSLPGDTLYPVKRAIEEARTDITMGQAGKGTAMLGNATDRLVEASGLAQRGSPTDLRAVDSTLGTFTEQSRAGADALLGHYDATGDETSVETIRDFTATSMEYLRVIEATVPDESRESLVEAARVIKDIDAAAAGACPQCGGAGVGQIPQVLLLSAGESPDEMVAALPLPQIGPDAPIVPEVELPDLDGPVVGDATGKVGLPGQDPTDPADAPDSGTGTKTGGTVEKAIDDLTRGLTGGSEEDPALLDEVGDSVDGLLDPVTTTLDQTLDGLLGGG